MAPLIPELSNQFYELLRKIAELRSLVKNIDLGKVEVVEEPEHGIPGRCLLTNDVVLPIREDFGREFIFLSGIEHRRGVVIIIYTLNNLRGLVSTPS